MYYFRWSKVEHSKILKLQNAGKKCKIRPIYERKYRYIEPQYHFMKQMCQQRTINTKLRSEKEV